MKRIQNKIGLTIVEVLVVVAIISVLAAGLYTVGNYVETQTKIKQTKSTIEILSAAIEQYHDFYGKCPYDYNNPSDPNLNIDLLYPRLSLSPDARKILSQINPSFIKDIDKDNRPEIIDAWGQEFRYKYLSDPNRPYNFPIIISAGPGKKFAGYINDVNDITSR